MGDGFGTLFRLTTFGESHGVGVGGVIEGCPPGLELDLARVQHEVDRRKPGQSRLTSMRHEADTVEWLSGLDRQGRTLGTAIAFLVRNQDADPTAYAALADTYRPSHADYTYEARYGLRAVEGGGRASARETLSRVVGGGVARQVLEHLGSIEVVAWVDRVERVSAQVDRLTVCAQDVEQNDVRCPDAEAAQAMIAAIKAARSEGDTVGGLVRAVARGLPAGLGAPVFDKLDADLARAMLSIPAAKGFEVGSGFAGTQMRGLAHNDAFIPDGRGGIATRTNHSGGIQGGISNGMPIELAVAFKPVATVFRPQDSVDRAGRPVSLTPRGRHDPCVLPRAVPIVEAMFCLVLLDHWLLWRGQVGSSPRGGA